jgi:hypothetical protein
MQKLANRIGSGLASRTWRLSRPAQYRKTQFNPIESVSISRVAQSSWAILKTFDLFYHRHFVAADARAEHVAR